LLLLGMSSMAEFSHDDVVSLCSLRVQAEGVINILDTIMISLQQPLCHEMR
jgi:hypothetical protein